MNIRYAKQKDFTKMQDGKYVVTDMIHIFTCDYGQLKLGVGVEFQIQDFGRIAVCSDGTRFPAAILFHCQNQYRKITEGR